jgi:hypothetical protein
MTADGTALVGDGEVRPQHREIVWRIPTGVQEAPPEYNIPNNTGVQFPRNAPLVTAGGLIFLATGPERKVHAYDRATGKELWQHSLPNGAEGMPATYQVNGRQFVVLPVAQANGTFPMIFNAPGAAPAPPGGGRQGPRWRTDGAGRVHRVRVASIVDREVFMRRSLGVAALCAASFAAGTMAQRLYDRSTGAAAASTAPVTAPANLASTVVDFAQQPLWAYGFPTPPAPGEKAEPQRPPSRALRPNEDEGEQTKPRSLPGSAGSFSLVDIRDGSNVIDWYPEDHPKMTDIIRLGPSKLETGRRGCGFCHLPNGLGRPENAPVAGLPPAYFVQQMKDFRNGLRRSSDPRKPNTNTMIDLARAMTTRRCSRPPSSSGPLSGSRG